MKASDRQEGGEHYLTKPVQPWDYIAANGLGYFEGNVVKYVSRWRDKGGVDDLRKARHYLDKLIELNVTPVGSTAEAKDFVSPYSTTPNPYGPPDAAKWP